MSSESSISDFYYIHQFDRTHSDSTNKKMSPKFCIAYQIYNDINLKFGVSLCSVKDAYDKKIGRKEALNRLLNNPSEISIDEFKNIIENMTYDLYFKFLGLFYNTYNKSAIVPHIYSMPLNHTNNIMYIDTLPINLSNVNNFSAIKRPYLNFFLSCHVYIIYYLKWESL